MCEKESVDVVLFLFGLIFAALAYYLFKDFFNAKLPRKHRGICGIFGFFIGLLVIACFKWSQIWVALF